MVNTQKNKINELWRKSKVLATALAISILGLFTQSCSSDSQVQEDLSAWEDSQRDLADAKKDLKYEEAELVKEEEDVDDCSDDDLLDEKIDVLEAKADVRKAEIDVETQERIERMRKVAYEASHRKKVSR